MQKTSFIISWLHWIWNYITGCWITDELLAFDFWIIVKKTLYSRKLTRNFLSELLSTGARYPKSNWKTKNERAHPSAYILLKLIPSYTSLKITKLLSRWWWKEEVPSWDTRQELRGLLLICFFDRINFDSKIQIRYVDIKNQLVDILTKGSFSEEEWNNLLRLKNIMTVCTFPLSHFSHFVSMRGPEQNFAKGSVVTKQNPMSSISTKTRPIILVSDASTIRVVGMQ